MGRLAAGGGGGPPRNGPGPGPPGPGTGGGGERKSEIIVLRGVFGSGGGRIAGTTGAGIKGGGGGGGGILMRCGATMDFPSTSFSRTIASKIRPLDMSGKGFLFRSSFRSATQASTTKSVLTFRMGFANGETELFNRTIKAFCCKYT